jgi:hypothetical protein
MTVRYLTLASHLSMTCSLILDHNGQYSYLCSTPLFILFSTGITTLEFKEGGFGRWSYQENAMSQ